MCTKGNPPSGQLIISFWNVEGYNSKLIGNKLEDPEFLNVVSKADILGLAELHADNKLSIPGFENIKQKNRGPKMHGGIGVFVRNELSHIVQYVPNNNEDSIWIKLKKEVFGSEEDLYIGTYYVSPENSKGKSSNDFGEALSEEIRFFDKKGTTLVQGDLNARTGNLKDFIEFDKMDFEEFEEGEDVGIGIGSELAQNLRNSEDKTVNKRGKELIDICKSYDMLIMNGRKIGDTVGKFTSHQYNGSAVVDYVLSPSRFAQNVSKFSVGTFIPWLSDHCSLHTTLMLSYSKPSKDTNTMKDVHPGFIWNIDAKAKFENGLKSTEIEGRINTLLQGEINEPSHIASEIKDILMTNSTDCNIKKKKTNFDGNLVDPWFDKECKDKKDHIQRLGKDVRRDPTAKNVRNELMAQKRIFKKMVKRKKILYKRETVNKMKSTHNKDAKNIGIFLKNCRQNLVVRVKTYSHINLVHTTNPFSHLTQLGHYQVTAPTRDLLTTKLTTTN